MDTYLRPEFFRRALRRRSSTILVALLLGLLAGGAAVAVSTAEYRATSVVFLDPLVGNPYSPTTPSGRQEQLAALTTEAGLVLMDDVVRSAERSSQDEGIDLGARIQERTSTEVPSNSQVVHISFAAESPEAAQAGANVLSAAYLESRQARSEAAIEAQVARADEEITSVSSLLEGAFGALDAAVPEGAEPTTPSAEVLNLEEQIRIYANQLGQLRIERSAAESASVSPGELVSPARLPGRPEGIPAPLVAVGVVVVLLGCGVVLAFVQEHLDTRLWTLDDIDAVGAGPAYGPMVPWQPQLRGTAAEDTYRLAINALQFDGTSRDVVALLSSDAASPEAVAAGLAHAVSATDRSVALVMVTQADADGVGSVGLSDVLQDGETPDPSGLLREVQPGLHVMGAGRRAVELPNLVQRPAFVELMDELAAKFDVLLLVGPDARTATGSAIARVAGDAVLVATIARTSQTALLASARVLEDCGVRLGGVLLVDRPTRKGRRGGSRAADRGRLETALPSGVDGTPSDPVGGSPESTTSVAASGGRHDRPSRLRIRTGGGDSSSPRADG